MTVKKCSVALAAAFALLALCACGEKDSGFSSEEFLHLPELRLSSFYASSDGDGSNRVKMRVPFDDTFKFDFAETQVKRVRVYDENGGVLASGSRPFELALKKDALIFAEYTAAKARVEVKVSAKANKSLLPFDPVNVPSPDSFSVTGGAEDPLQPANLTYKKRADTLYAYSNAPEALTDNCLNTAMIRHDVTDREVFFTFEHQTGKLKTGAYYGYQVRNTGTEDMYVTVKNAGMQVYGAGSFYGEQEWTQFYNTEFKLPDKSEWSQGEHDSFAAWYGFSGKYKSLNYQPATYKIPAGNYMYVLGGTKSDSYNNYTVLGADAKTNESCQNGAVLFHVTGEAEAAFFVYEDPAKIKDDVTSHYGVRADSKRENIGTDEGAMVDGQATWIFNDATPAQSLPVTFTNYYKDFPEAELGEDGKPLPVTGEPFAAIESTAHEQTARRYYTHSNVQSNHLAVGTDMTDFHSIYEGKREIVVGNHYFDASGRLANIGNWMKDYIDTYTFVNQGDNEREITVEIIPENSGALTTLVRGADGKLIEGTAGYSMKYKATQYGDEIFEPFRYTVTVKPHSVLQFHVEYNLMANSYGKVSHEVFLK